MQYGTCNTIYSYIPYDDHALYKCQEVFDKLPTLIFSKFFKQDASILNRYLASALLVRLHIGGGS